MFSIFPDQSWGGEGANMILAQGSLGGDGDESPQLRSKPGFFFLTPTGKGLKRK